MIQVVGVVPVVSSDCNEDTGGSDCAGLTGYAGYADSAPFRRACASRYKPERG